MCYVRISTKLYIRLWILGDRKFSPGISCESAFIKWRYWFCKLGVGHNNLPLYKSPKWHQCCWFINHILNSSDLEHISFTKMWQLFVENFFILLSWQCFAGVLLIYLWNSLIIVCWEILLSISEKWKIKCFSLSQVICLSVLTCTWNALSIYIFFAN